MDILTNKGANSYKLEISKWGSMYIPTVILNNKKWVLKKI